MGLSLSWAANLPAGPAIVLTASGLFFIGVFGSRSRLVVGWRKIWWDNDETYGYGWRWRWVWHRTGDGENAKRGEQFSVLGDMVQQIGGEHVHVDTPVGPDGDPHTFEPRRKTALLNNRAGGGQRPGAGGLAGPAD